MPLELDLRQGLVGGVDVERRLTRAGDAVHLHVHLDRALLTRFHGQLVDDLAGVGAVGVLRDPHQLLLRLGDQLVVTLADFDDGLGARAAAGQIPPDDGRGLRVLEREPPHSFLVAEVGSEIEIRHREPRVARLGVAGAGLGTIHHYRRVQRQPLCGAFRLLLLGQ